ncbi:MAG TPA: aminotransferase class IV [Candidatus Saccharimonadales bacterium]|nr:aminotransferase class IV [Candidatus Saccharimonadales bacterium]
MVFKHFSKNGQILSIADAVIPLQNIEYSYGFGIYETLRVRGGIVYFVKQHFHRLLNSAIILGIEHEFSEKDIAIYLSDLLKIEKLEDCNIKMLLIGGKTREDSLLFILPLSPLFPNRKFYTNGVKTITYKYERLLPQAKTLNMLGSYLAYKKANDKVCYDALLIDRNNYITEGTRTNFFTIKNNILYTQYDDKILNGVTRETVNYVAKNCGFEIVKKNITLEELQNYDGAFLTSTSSKIVPIKQIDNFEFPEIAESIKLLIQEYDKFLKNSKGIFNEAK